MFNHKQLVVLPYDIVLNIIKIIIEDYKRNKNAYELKKQKYEQIYTSEAPDSMDDVRSAKEKYDQSKKDCQSISLVNKEYFVEALRNTGPRSLVSELSQIYSCQTPSQFLQETMSKLVNYPIHLRFAILRCMQRLYKFWENVTSVHELIDSKMARQFVGDFFEISAKENSFDTALASALALQIEHLFKAYNLLPTCIESIYSFSHNALATCLELFFLEAHLNPQVTSFNLDLTKHRNDTGGNICHLFHSELLKWIPTNRDTTTLNTIKLNLSGHKIDNEGLLRLMYILTQRNHNIINVDLGLSHNCIHCLNNLDNLYNLYGELNNSSLNITNFKIDLSHNNIGLPDAKAIAWIIKNNNTKDISNRITTLIVDLRNNRLGLSRFPVRGEKISAAEISSEGIKAITEALHNDTTLTHVEINVDGNDLASIDINNLQEEVSRINSRQQHSSISALETNPSAAAIPAQNSSRIAVAADFIEKVYENSGNRFVEQTVPGDGSSVGRSGASFFARAQPPQSSNTSPQQHRNINLEEIEFRCSLPLP